MPSERSIRPDPCNSWPYPPANRPEFVTYQTASKLPTNLHLLVRRLGQAIVPAPSGKERV